MDTAIIICTVCFGILAVILTVYDKIAAKNKLWRVPERILFLTALCGGSVAMYLTMLIIRHKTKHKSFMLGLPAIILLQTALAFIIK